MSSNQEESKSAVDTHEKDYQFMLMYPYDYRTLQLSMDYEKKQRREEEAQGISAVQQSINFLRDSELKEFENELNEK